MGKTKKRRLCVVCRRKYAVKDSNACSEHLHVAALQRHIDDQTSLSSGGVAALIADYEPFRDLIKVVLQARWLATVGKGSSIATIGRTGFDDGTVDYADTVVHSAQAASVKRFQGLLGHMMDKRNGPIQRLVDELEDMIDPNRPQRRDTRIRCGECADPRTRHRWQAADSRFCRWCGRSFIEEEREGAA